MLSFENILTERLKKGIALSTELKEKKERSKTKTRRNYYDKKLKTSNLLNGKILMALDSLEKKEKANESSEA